MKTAWICISAALFFNACYESNEFDRAPTDATDAASGSSNDRFEHPRRAYYSAEDSDYGYYEGTFADNDCTADDDCQISGCQSSTCAAEPVVIDDEQFCAPRMLASMVAPYFSSCGCIDRRCIWYFEDDFDRPCESDEDCRGLGFLPDAGIRKSIWYCEEKECRLGWPELDE